MKADQRGRFIVLEGIDGAGTTTQAGRIQTWLRERGINSVITREPSDGPVGVVIRNGLRGRIGLPAEAGGGPLRPETIALLFAADRVDHLAAEIEPALARGVWVISDRFVHSSIAYQGSFMAVEWVAAINRCATAPDITLFLRIDPAVALARVFASRVTTDLFENRELLERVAAGYDRWYAAHPEAATIIDGSAPLDQVSQAVRAALVAGLPELA